MTKYLLIAVGVLAILLAGTAAAWRMSVLSNERDQYRAEAEQAKALAGDYQRRVEAGNAIERTYLEAVKSAKLKTISFALISLLVLAGCTSKPVVQCSIPEPPQALMQEEPSLLPLMDKLFQISEPELSEKKR